MNINVIAYLFGHMQSM